ncbi:MAG: NPCBM/NEW2 domain-containing protein, partial [Bacteroidales bacterium]|nr:NPCBM/NEW2 domain-containing protein [Bacteroidales bacterium]
VVGADDSYSGAETVRFRVLNEDFFGNRVLFDSGMLTREQAGVKIDIDVKGVEYLLLLFEGKGVAGNWAEAKVIADGR